MREGAYLRVALELIVAKQKIYRWRGYEALSEGDEVESYHNGSRRQGLP
jgi:hypothetical protein